MSVRNINQGYYDLPEIVNAACTNNGYLTKNIPTQFLNPSSTASFLMNALIILGNDYSQGVFTLNMTTGELRIYPNINPIIGWIIGSTCGLYENATLVWNMI